jgi:hypothetical protein
MLDASIIPARQDVAYAQAHWSRTRDRLASSAIDSRGPEEWAVAIVLVQQPAQFHLAPFAQVFPLRLRSTLMVSSFAFSIASKFARI